MDNLCQQLHDRARRLQRHRFPFDAKTFPLNGIYLLFEMGETGHGGDRIVRIGTHTGENQLPSRLRQHFMIDNKDRSIFRKNIGRCLLHADSDPYLDVWNLDRTARDEKKAAGIAYDADRQARVERRVSEFIRYRLSFVVISVADKSRRLHLESRLISTVSCCRDCGPSPKWPGLGSPVEKIRRSGLWQVNELWKTALDAAELRELG